VEDGVCTLAGPARLLILALRLKLAFISARPSSSPKEFAEWGSCYLKNFTGDSRSCHPYPKTPFMPIASDFNVTYVVDQTALLYPLCRYPDSPFTSDDVWPLMPAGRNLNAQTFDELIRKADRHCGAVSLFDGFRSFFRRLPQSFTLVLLLNGLKRLPSTDDPAVST
jgi:hypothetical protein